MINKRLSESLPTYTKHQVSILPRIYKIGTQKGKILLRLSKSHSMMDEQGKVRSLVLNQIGYRYPSRIHEMKEDGWLIETTQKGFQEHYYELDRNQTDILVSLVRNENFRNRWIEVSKKREARKYANNKS